MSNDKKGFITFKNEKYVCIGYSKINFEEEYKYYKSTVMEIVENSKFHTPEHGVFNDSWYEEISPILQRWASIFVSPHYPNLIFVFGKLFNGTYIFEKVEKEK